MQTYSGNVKIFLLLVFAVLLYISFHVFIKKITHNITNNINNKHSITYMNKCKF